MLTWKNYYCVCQLLLFYVIEYLIKHIIQKKIILKQNLIFDYYNFFYSK